MFASTHVKFAFSIGFSALRMYAIYNKSRRVLALLLLMGIVNPCVSIVGLFAQHPSQLLMLLATDSIIARRSLSKRCHRHSEGVDSKANSATPLSISSCTFHVCRYVSHVGS